jgi:hypothetical protein
MRAKFHPQTLHGVANPREVARKALNASLIKRVRVTAKMLREQAAIVNLIETTISRIDRLASKPEAPAFIDHPDEAVLAARIRPFQLLISQAILLVAKISSRKQ